MNQNLYLWVIPLLPLAGAAINGVFGRRFKNSMVSAVALFFTAVSFGWAVWATAQWWGHSDPYIQNLGDWIWAGRFHAPFGFYLDRLSTVMVLVVTGVGFLIHIYSVGYMAHEGGYYRFFAYLNLFMFFMLTLVLANNYLLMFVGWEGVGLASYLLIGFFFLKDSAADAGKKAFIVNRIGDFAFLIGMFLLIQHFGSLNYDTVFKNRVIVQRAKMLDEQEHPNQECEVADAVDDECFFARVGSGILQKEETNQQIGRETHAFPAHEHQQIVVRQHQREHEEHEEVQVRKEPIVAAFMRHVSDRVNMNQEPDAGDHQHHDHGELVKIKTERRGERAGGDPCGKRFNVGQGNTAARPHSPDGPRGPSE